MVSKRRRLSLILFVLGSFSLSGFYWAYTEYRAEERSSGDRLALARADKDEPRKDAPEPDKEGFRFPDDKGGQLLNRVLSPSLSGAALAERRQTPHRPGMPASLESPTLPLQPANAGMPRAGLEPKRPVLMPRLVIDETIAGDSGPALPATQSFVTGARSRDTGIDVNQPPPLPVLSVPVPDRASLEDPTTDASILAAVAATVPLRATQVPFQRQGIPDPFENHTPVRLSDPPAENAEPPIGPARNPKP